MIAGIRITIDLLLEKLGAGESVEQILEAHPRLSEREIGAALQTWLTGETPVENIAYSAYLVEKVRKSLKTIENEGGMDQAEVEETMNRRYPSRERPNPTSRR